MRLRALDGRWLSLLVLLAGQVIFTVYYVVVVAPLKPPPAQPVAPVSVNFVDAPLVNTSSGRNPLLSAPVYLSRLQLDRRKSFLGLNSSDCFLPGTEVDFSQRMGKCQCQPGWHGQDCGLPEVILRAFITAKYTEPPKLRRKPRRVLCLVRWTSDTLTEILFSELDAVVDLFIVDKKPDAKFNKEKVLVLQNTDWAFVKHQLIDLRYDDLVLSVDDSEIPNPNALLFLKFYNGWPYEPITFRMRWSVFGFFWLHPQLTTLAGRVCSVGTLARTFRDDLRAMRSSKEVLVVGDLNHFGGWRCQLCLDSAEDILHQAQTLKDPAWNLKSRRVDAEYVSELVGQGLWVDGRTHLLRASPSREQNYFAPAVVRKGNFGHLLHNFYEQNDY
ncbi:beta-1,4-mannosyl-glycoprotein 4-beta-N-acetylglucosaminyltransferase [Neocloeon triangulifer]|uniref:beta-1,4-mannosyl-glycoprotein 4-beta-N-acetylglucosaminyltransferase n=1 Tax=Neocloeon triangulifer TaxID=2078957 RepID=UPI00286F73B3|nr:beta-1,4-mannosyl-glycoprotein 4-beta-N-acetylglucosaminyltransferase [Neocloeon triangulifer]XP_059477258.1 beta-1,4-mannosyl-glycoprotein 4-beta-N-acetylglucosaminyltransferase [Neocloeon triangulifer]